MSYHRRRTLETWEEAAALAVGAMVGGAAAYLVRVWLARWPVDRKGRRDRSDREEKEGPDRDRPAGRGVVRPR